MTRSFVVASLLLLVACGGSKEEDTSDATDPGSCLVDAGCTASSQTDSGGCNVYVDCDDGTSWSFGAFCYETPEGTDCSCGAAADSPPSFVEEGFCDLDFEAAACRARELCSNWTF